MQSGTVRQMFEDMGIQFHDMKPDQPVKVQNWEVKTLDSEGNFVWKKVLHAVRKPNANHYRLSTKSGCVLDASPEHKVLVKCSKLDQDYFELAKLKDSARAGLVVRTVGGWEPFTVTQLDGDIEIADIEVEGEHSYLSNGILSHNTLYGDPTTTPGGNAIPYHASLRLKLSGGQQIKRTVNGREMVIGIAVDVKVIKNKVARPWRQCSFEIHFGKGIVESEQLFDELRQYCEKSGKALVNGKHISVSGTQAWKTFEVSDAESGEVLHEIKFQKSTFQELIIDNPLVKNYFDDLVDAAFIIGNTDEHFSFASVDTDSHEEVSAAKLEADGGKAVAILLND